MFVRRNTPELICFGVCLLVEDTTSPYMIKQISHQKFASRTTHRKHEPLAEYILSRWQSRVLCCILMHAVTATNREKSVCNLHQVSVSFADELLLPALIFRLDWIPLPNDTLDSRCEI